VNTEADSVFEPNSFLAIVNTLGHSVLIETLKMAAFYVSHSNNSPNSRMQNLQIREGKMCYAFVQGTGLDILINRFGMSYNSDYIRDQFNYLVRHT